MPDNQTTLFLACRTNNKTMTKKPEPPSNLWETLDAEVSAMDQCPPEGSFTVGTIVERYGKTYSEAEGVIRRLIASGKAKEIGRFGCRHSKYFLMA